MRHASLSVLILALASCTSGTPPQTATTSAMAPTATPESAIGLVPGRAEVQPEQQPIAFNTVDPGDAPVRPRPNPEFPPVVPHSLDGLEPITPDDNPCLGCHLGEAAVDSGATPIPPSHFVDLRNAPEVVSTEPVGARFNCTACHVAQTDTRPLVTNPS